MKHFATLFDKNYLVKGLILQKSLHRHMNEPYMMHILAMDAETERELQERDLDCVNVIPLARVEESIGLYSVRQSRTWQEYCWTMASQLMEFLLPVVRPGDTLTYLDADLMFFSDPQPIFDEMGDKSIAIIPHRFTPVNRARLEKNGKFNVSWVTIRGDEIGMRCIRRWAQQCRQWCYYRNEDGKFGDQKYLDQWPSMYNGHVCEIQNIGAGLAPWNLGNCRLASLPTDEGDIIAVDGQPLIFYHYHETQLKDDGSVVLTMYPLRPMDKQLIYRPYLEAASQIAKRRFHHADIGDKASYREDLIGQPVL